MRVETLSLENFRNFVHVEEITFPEAPLLVAAAPNATGKTNFLESIHVLLRGKSFRATAEECISFEKDSFIIQGTVKRGEDVSQLAVRYHKPTRKLRVEEDGVPASPVAFYSHYPFVLFLPDDTFMFSRGPAVRRNFLNTVIVSAPIYLSSLVQYHRILRQRNAALKQARSADDVKMWTDLLITYAATIWGTRTSLVTFLQTHVSDIYKEFTNETQVFNISLQYGAPDPDNLERSFTEAWPQEQRYQYTMYGPHRDDLVITSSGRPVSTVLSRGQMRALIIALKVASYNYIKQTTKEDPLLQFDEVLSELDESRQRILLEHLPSTQMILTCTTLPKELQRRDDVHVLDLRSILQQQTEAKEEPVKTVPVQESSPVPS